jgi:hypothetical protein
MANLEAEEIMRLQVTLGQTRAVGDTGAGRLVVIPITGGTMRGARINGKVVPGGADWNLTLPDCAVHVFAKYLLETDDGEFIAIENEGMIEPNSPSVIKTVPRFMANMEGNYHYLNHGVYAGELSATLGVQDRVDIVIYRLR